MTLPQIIKKYPNGHYRRKVWASRGYWYVDLQGYLRDSKSQEPALVQVDAMFKKDWYLEKNK